MGINRKQLSLIIRDDELFTNFIKPCADSGELNNVIIKCLSSYYYKDDVRSLIDGVEQEEEVQETVQIKGIQDSINDIRQALAMQSFYAESLQDELESGIEDMADILQRTTEKAEEDGLVKTEQSKSGNTVARIIMKNAVKNGEVVDFAELQESMLDRAKHGDYSGAFEATAKVQTELAEKLDKLISLIESGKTTSEDLKNIASSLSNDEVVLNESTTVNDFESSVDDTEPTIQEEVVQTTVEPEKVIEEPVIVPEQKPIDGSDALGDLLGSLFG